MKKCQVDLKETMNISQRIVALMYPVESQINLLEATLIMKRISAIASKNENLMIYMYGLAN